jgi:predicted TIM-barrel fold metal-dependent hydrolase
VSGERIDRPTGTISVDFQGLNQAELAVISFRNAKGGQPPSGQTIIDASVHPRPRPGELQEYLPKIWKGRRLPLGERYYYPNPLGDYVKEAYGSGGPPGSDPDLVSRHLFDEAGISQAILLPLTLGLLPDIDLQAAVCSASNAWLAETWLGQYNAKGRYKGTIRVTPTHPDAAVAEIEKWADHPGFVQVGVPLQSMQLYGNRVFLPIWEAAARHNLPIVIHADAETGVEFAPTTAGYLRHYLGFVAYQPITFINHLTSFMANGVLDHLPSLRVVFADGGYDMCAPFIWRLDKDYRPMRGDMPWMKKLPSSYIKNQVRFVAHSLEGPEDPGILQEWLNISEAEHVLIFGSNYPYWNVLHPGAAFTGSIQHSATESWQVLQPNSMGFPLVSRTYKVAQRRFRNDTASGPRICVCPCRTCSGSRKGRRLRHSRQSAQRHGDSSPSARAVAK